jgi:hypothetical protein
VAKPNIQQNFGKKNIILPSQYSFDITNTIFPTFQTQYMLDFTSARRSETLGFAKH